MQSIESLDCKHNRQGNEELGLPSLYDMAYHMFGLKPTDFPNLVEDLMTDDELMLASDSNVIHCNGDIYFCVWNDYDDRLPPKTLQNLPWWVEQNLRIIWSNLNVLNGYHNEPVDRFGKLQENIDLYLAFFQDTET